MPSSAIAARIALPRSQRAAPSSLAAKNVRWHERTSSGLCRCLIQQAPPTQRPDLPTDPATTAGNDATTTAQEISDEQADVLGELDDLQGALGAL